MLFRSQAGVTAIGLILMLIPMALVAYMLIRAVPVYIESFSIGDAINSLKKEPDLIEKSQDEIRNMIKKRLDVNDIHSIDEKDVKIQKTVNDVKVNVDYEVKVPLFGNVALALSFQKSAVVR